MNRIKLNITNRRGQSIVGHLDLPPDQKPFYYAVLLHCFGSGQDANSIRLFAETFTSNGFGLFSIDCANATDGDWAYAPTVEDVEDVCQYLSSHHGDPGLLIGHSVGGAVTLMAAARVEGIKAVSVIGAPSNSRFLKRIVKGKVKTNDGGKLKGLLANVAQRSFLLEDSLLRDLDAFMSEDMTTKQKPLLIIHASQDEEIDIESGTELFRQAHQPKSFLSLDRADHVLSNQDDLMYCGEVIGSWSRRYLAPVETEPKQREYETVTRIGDLPYKFQVRIMAGRHAMKADEPEEAGGNDTGPTPYQLLSAALGACTAMTLRMYADRKKWPMSAANVYLNHAKRYSDDCLQCEEESSRIDHFDRVIEVKGDLSDDQRNKLLEIANKCPVHRTLEGEIRINTSLRTEE